MNRSPCKDCPYELNPKDEASSPCYDCDKPWIWAELNHDPYRSQPDDFDESIFADPDLYQCPKCGVISDSNIRVCERCR